MSYYIYEHRKPTGEVFYVGKGTGRRAFSMSRRSIKWNEVVEQSNGITIEIVERYEKEEEAFEAEESLIKKHVKNGAVLVNATSGGRGPKDYIQSESTRQKKSEKMSGYSHELVTCPHCGFTGGATSTKRWHFDNCKGKRPEHQSRIHIFGTRYYLGKYMTKQEANDVANEFKELVLQEAGEM